MDKKELIGKFVDAGCLLSPELIYTLENENPENILGFLETLKERVEKPLILTSKFFLEIKTPKIGVEVKKEITMGQTKLARKEMELKLKIKEKPEEEKERDIKKVNSIKILYSYSADPQKISVENFTNYFRNRYLKLRDLLVNRPELEKMISINKIGNEREDFSIIGMIQEKRITKNGNVFLVLEDFTGSARVIVSNRNKELFDKGENLIQDEVVGIRGRGNNQFIFANEVVQADFYGKEKIKGGKGHALFISDLHIGSNKFLVKQFNNFIRWINLKTNSKHTEIAEKCKYLFVLGDIVDGVGVYPNQSKELIIKDIYEQYEEASYLLSQIRDDVKIIMIPGNHDATQQAIPQPVFDEQYAAPLFKIKNVLNLSNPAYINIASNENFKGYDIMLYHGYSLNYFANNVRSLINKGYKNPGLLLSYLLKRRHLAPTHGSTPYLPLSQDPLLIEKIPDVLATGDLHKLSASYHNNVALIACSCWQAKTPFQLKVGHEPEPCKVPALDLKNNTIKILDFS